MLRSLILIVALLCSSVVTAESARPEDEVLGVSEAPPGGDFTLQSSKGDFLLTDLRGKVALLYFGYTNCPDVCPTGLMFAAQAMNGLTEEEMQKVQTVFISVDPKRDTYDVLDEYVEYFHPNMIGVTGSDDSVAKAASLYGVKYYEVDLQDSYFGYAVNHSAVTYLINPRGELRFMFPHKTPSPVITEAIRYTLADQ